MDRAERSSGMAQEQSISADIGHPLPETLVGRACTIDGEISSEHDMRIEGTVLGGIDCKGLLRVEAGARVRAQITAGNLVISGYVEGNIACSGRVEIAPSGQVTGEMGTGTLVMREGAVFDGELHMVNRAPGSLAMAGPESVQAPRSKNSTRRT